MNSHPTTLFISHGGGPLPLLGDPAHHEMLSCLQGIASSIPRPEAIIVISAHWEEQIPAITSDSKPPLIYDYYGFPPESYEIKYPCAGDPALAQEIRRVLGNAEIESTLDEKRGLDHGVFIPLKIMYPEADIPCVQLSLVNSLDPNLHIEMGKSLRYLSKKNVLIIGSGFSFHNLRAFFSPSSADSVQQNEAFETWLQNACSNRELSEQARREQLINWNTAPGARFCHPREEHLLPLHLCYGVAQAPCTQLYELTIMNKKSSMYLWR
ncbi:MAG: class III extradiol ring-cleavage dioxygenase [Pseudohongiellaceae bacterium]